MIGFPAIIILKRFAILNGACHLAPGVRFDKRASSPFPRVLTIVDKQRTTVCAPLVAVSLAWSVSPGL